MFIKGILPYGPVSRREVYYNLKMRSPQLPYYGEANISDVILFYIKYNKLKFQVKFYSNFINIVPLINQSVTRKSCEYSINDNRFKNLQDSKFKISKDSTHCQNRKILSIPV